MISNLTPIQQNITIDQPPTQMSNFELLKSASSEVDYQNLFRGLSSFELTSVTSLLESKNDANRDEKLDTEKTYSDLTDLLLQEQALNSASFANTKEKMLSQLNPVDINLLTQQDNKSQSYNSEIESAIDDSSSVSSYSYKPAGARVSVKRLSNASTSTVSSDIIEPRKSTRGRKPASARLNGSIETPIATNKKMTKKQLMLLEAKNPVVCFGNKVVEKDTDEYKVRRSSNNDAVKKCRQKQCEMQVKREHQMKKLDDENKKLTSTVESLSKELSMLKDIIIRMSPGKKLPEHIETVMNRI